MDEKEYKIIRHSVQLDCVNVGELHIEGDILKLKNAHGKMSQKFNLSQNLKTSESNPFSIEGKCKVVIDINHRSFDTPYKICLVIIGIFSSELKATNESEVNSENEKNEFATNVSKLCIPLLLPYVKSYLQMVTGILSIPPFPIPTMDILRSIEENNK